VGWCSPCSCFYDSGVNFFDLGWNQLPGSLAFAAVFGASSKMTKLIKVETSHSQHVILVVDDEPLIRFSLSLHLEGCGFQVITAANAAEAVEILTEPGCLVDLVFSDVRMPGKMDGVGLSRWIFDNRPNIAVILASGEIGKTTAIHELCAAETLAKPFDYDYATDKIRAAIKRNSPSASGLH
jgi:DNA-binding NtrC family response regulator